MNIDENTMKNIKNMVDNGNISDAISQISPEMIQNFSKMLSNQENTNSNQSSNFNQNQSNGNTSNSNGNSDLNGIDIDTIKKMAAVFGKMNNSKDDPRANLLNSLKPYLRESKKGQLDNYINLLNVTKIAEIMKENKENKDNV